MSYCFLGQKTWLKTIPSSLPRTVIMTDTDAGQSVVTARELEGVFLQVDDDLFDDLLRQHATA